jgi:hypothetical protein
MTNNWVAAFFGTGENAEELNAAVLNREGISGRERIYMRDALDLVMEKYGSCNRPFGQTLYFSSGVGSLKTGYKTFRLGTPSVLPMRAR